MINSTRISLTLAFVAMLPQAALANIVCEGTYEFFNGKDTVNAIPGEAPENGALAARLYNAQRGAWLGQFMGKPKSEGLHEVKVSQCGRQFTLSQGSKTMLFLQSIMDDTLYVAQDIGTNEAELTLRVVDHKIMVGSVKGKSHGFAFNIPVAMDPRDVSMPDMKRCNDDTAATPDTPAGDRLTVDPALRSEVIGIVADELGVPRDQSERYISALRSVAKTRQSDEGVSEILPGEPGCPIELTGVKTCRVFPPDTTTVVEVNLLLDGDGRLLPVTTDGSDTGRIRVDDPGVADLCAPESTLPPAEQRLRFKFFAIEEDGINDVQAGLLDARTDHFKKAHYAKGKSQGRQGRADAADEAYRAIGSPVTGRHKSP
ncbi:hypothetical protein [Paracoccus thiocyanatus]|uniref:DUF3617 domain-containing protein n=1 Tax=Paracoccus thiocyanatus TaxID=34006 RepID=A0A1N7AD55_9RHOB|nr:hypothetical protein [Paracoccus thiocyanatus]SIR37035.1 hypothetical protein SAMN05421641_1473 [Paracoccus thiocyanatus]